MVLDRRASSQTVVHLYLVQYSLDDASMILHLTSVFLEITFDELRMF